MIDDEYWLQYAKSSVEKSITSRNEAASKLEKLTLWFWGLYTASFTIGVTINLIDAPLCVLILLSCPIILLMITYWSCVHAQLPVTAEYHTNIPYEIQEGYNAGLKVKNKRFSRSLYLTFISALFLGTALFSLAFVHKKENFSINAFFNEGKDKIIISGLLQKNTVIKTNIDSLDDKRSKINFYNNTFKVQENGILSLNVPMNPMPKEIIITTTWKEDNFEKGFVHTLSR